jgi:hypothetical protein
VDDLRKLSLGVLKAAVIMSRGSLVSEVSATPFLLGGPSSVLLELLHAETILECISEPTIPPSRAPIPAAQKLNAMFPAANEETAKVLTGIPLFRQWEMLDFWPGMAAARLSSLKRAVILVRAEESYFISLILLRRLIPLCFVL